MLNLTTHCSEHTMHAVYATAYYYYNIMYAIIMSEVTRCKWDSKDKLWIRRCGHKAGKVRSDKHVVAHQIQRSNSWLSFWNHLYVAQSIQMWLTTLCCLFLGRSPRMQCAQCSTANDMINWRRIRHELSLSTKLLDGRFIMLFMSAFFTLCIECEPVRHAYILILFLFFLISFTRECGGMRFGLTFGALSRYLIVMLV